MSWKHYSVINRCIRAMPPGKQASLCRGNSETDHKVTRHTMQQVSSTVDGNHLAWTMSIWKEDEHSSFGWQFSTGVQTFSGQAVLWPAAGWVSPDKCSSAPAGATASTASRKRCQPANLLLAHMLHIFPQCWFFTFSSFYHKSIYFSFVPTSWLS